MKLLFLLDHFHPYIGGVETLFDQITQQHIKQGHQVTVITNNHTGSLHKHEIKNGIHIYRVGKGRKNRGAMITLGSQLIQQHPFDLIHTTTYSAALPAWILSKRYHIPNQLHVHEIYGELRHQFLGIKAYCNKWFEKLIVGLLPRDRYICVSRYTLNSVRTHFNLPDHKLHLTPNPVDDEFWQPYTSEQEEEIRTSKIKELSPLSAGEKSGVRIGLYYGRTGIEKGLDLYLQALPEIIKQYPRFHAIIIAPQDEPKTHRRSKRQTSYTLKHMIKQLGLERSIARVPLVSSKEEIRDRITASDVVILPSRTEGFGYAMHEVALMNKSLITTQVGGQTETLSGYDTIYWMKQVTSEEVVAGVGIMLQKSKDVANCATKYEKYCNILLLSLQLSL